jgi:stage IV sporulation protein FB
MFQFSLLRFPVRVHWTFGLMALFIGGGFRVRGPEDWPPVLAAVGVIFVSILVHELGHALAGRRFGARPAILLHSMGGLCYLPGGRFSRGQNILVSLAGPAAGFLLAALTVVLLYGLAPTDRLVRYAFLVSLYVNVVWTLLNLLPILPLDGGQVFRDLLGPARIQVARWVGAGTAGLLCLIALSFGFYLGAIMAAVLAFLNFRGSTIEGGVVKDDPRPEPVAER